MRRYERGCTEIKEGSIVLKIHLESIFREFLHKVTNLSCPLFTHGKQWPNRGFGSLARHCYFLSLGH
jgi:hypothetical protein